MSNMNCESTPMRFRSHGDWMHRRIKVVLVLCLMVVSAFGVYEVFTEESGAMAEQVPEGLEKATLAGGCFWCMEPPYDNLDGVVSTTAGYTGGHVPNPSYQQVTTGTTGHVEAVEVLFDPSKTSYDEVLDAFWRNIDPTQATGQFADLGPQYKTAIFYHSEEQKHIATESKTTLNASGVFDQPVVTDIKPASEFYVAEENHQNYYLKQPAHYKRYKEGSGRAGFLRRMWGKK